MLTVLTANSQAGDFTIANSLRFRSSASAYLSRTPASAGNRQTWTWSGWVKGYFGVASNLQLFTTNFASASTTSTYLTYANSGNIALVNYNAGVADTSIVTTPIYRDPSSWYHVMCVVDTTQSTASNRIKIYVNGIQVTALGTATYPAQNTNTSVNNSVIHSIGALRVDNVPSQFFDGYLADINFIDGQALTPSSFGAFDTITGVWTPARYTGSYGTNGFKLNFSNGTSTTTLGYDSSGNGNNWTTNNISLTAGSTYDWMLDSPTPFAGTSYGVGNYAVLNPLYAYSSFTLSGGNLNAASTANYRSAISTIGVSSGKWYWEYVVTAVGNDTVIGITSNPTATVGTYAGGDAASWGYEALSGNKYNNGAFSAYGAAYTTNDVIGIAFDANAGSLTFYKNGVSQGVAYSGLASGTYYAAFGLGNPSTGSANFGQRPFTYTPPTGYKALNTQNLSAPSIVNGANYFNAIIWTGADTATSRSFSGLAFAPDLWWNKPRSQAYSHMLYDSVRGAGSTKELSSNSTAVEGGTNAATYGYLSSFDSAGVTWTRGSAGSGTNPDGYADYDELNATYVAWTWKAGGTAVTNTAGSITSSVSANTTAGFSVVTYTGTGANATVGHGLGVAPSMIIIKDRGAANLWVVYHASLGATGYLSLNSTAAFATLSTVFNNTAPTSSVISIGVASGTNNTSGMVAYCFAAIPGYSAFGSYTGNGSADGPFVYCGFRPRFILWKCSSSPSAWMILDTSRNTYNETNSGLFPDVSSAEATSSVYAFDIVSNGFKVRTSNATINGSGATSIYAAFAENPFQNALAR